MNIGSVNKNKGNIFLFVVNFLLCNTDAGVLPKRKFTTFATRRKLKLKIKNFPICYNLSFIKILPICCQIRVSRCVPSVALFPQHNWASSGSESTQSPNTDSSSESIEKH
jgi:hypothetical protein